MNRIIEDHYEELLSLDKRIVATGLRIKQLTQDDPIVQWLLSQKGVGLVTACLLRAEIGRVDRFHSGKQLARFCGVTPRNASSGNRQADAGLIRAGNPDLRTTLIELAHRLIRQADGPWRPMAAAMLTRGKPKNVVVAAIANRWVRKLFHLWPKPGQMQNHLDSLGSVRGFSEESQGKKNEQQEAPKIKNCLSESTR